MTVKEKEFYRGFSVALGILHNCYPEFGALLEVMGEAGISIEKLEEAECEESDLIGIREALGHI